MVKGALLVLQGPLVQWVVQENKACVESKACGERLVYQALQVNLEGKANRVQEVQLVPPVLLAKPDHVALLVCLALKVPEENVANPVRQELMVSQEKLVPKDHRVHLDHPARQVREENRALEESQDWLDHQANQVWTFYNWFYVPNINIFFYHFL